MFANIFHGEPGEKKNIPPPIHLSWQDKKFNLAKIILDIRDRHTLEHNDLAKFALTFGFPNFSLTYSVFKTDKTICFRVLPIHKILVGKHFARLYFYAWKWSKCVWISYQIFILKWHFPIFQSLFLSKQLVLTWIQNYDNMKNEVGTSSLDTIRNQALQAWF